MNCVRLTELLGDNVKRSIHKPVHGTWDWDQTGIKLGTKLTIYQKLANFM